MRWVCTRKGFYVQAAKGALGARGQMGSVSERAVKELGNRSSRGSKESAGKGAELHRGIMWVV